MTYSESRLIKPAQATRAQKPAPSNMVAQALCEPVPNDATRSIANFNPSLLSAISNIKYREYVLLIIWPQLTFSAMEYLGS
jgi:hypothetical protein